MNTANFDLCVIQRHYNFLLRYTVGFSGYIREMPSYLGHQNLPEKVRELAERQYTPSKEQSHVASKLTCMKEEDDIKFGTGQIKLLQQHEYWKEYCHSRSNATACQGKQRKKN